MFDRRGVIDSSDGALRVRRPVANTIGVSAATIVHTTATLRAGAARDPESLVNSALQLSDVSLIAYHVHTIPYIEMP